VRSAFVLAALLGGLTLLAAGCGGGGGDKSIVLYNGQHLQLTRAIIAAFEKETGVSVRMRSNSGVVLADLILQEGDKSPADVYLSENSPELMNLEQKGMLAKLDESVLGQVPARYSSPNGNWVGVAQRVSSLVCNPSLMPDSKLPRSILDLAEPQWKGKLGIAPLDADFPPVVGAVIAVHGEDDAARWLDGLKDNANVYQDAEAVVSAVNRGDEACGIVNSYYWYRLQREQGAARMHSKPHYFPSSDVGSVVNVGGAGILESSGHKEDAERFVEFMVSREGQELLAKGDDYEYPTRPGVAASAVLPPLAQVAHRNLSVADLGDNSVAAKLIRDAGFGT
jgi:iron(III) transport system substrate-binding protein